jgi:DNA invertase Pin-like site-specific DNA recombinase
MASSDGAPFDVVVVHSFSRFARDHFALEYHVRRLRKAGVRLVSMTQDLGDDPMSVMVRQVFALFDEYQGKREARPARNAGKRAAGILERLGGAVRLTDVAAEQRGAKTKKKLAVDPVEAETVRLIFRLVREGDGTNGP